MEKFLTQPYEKLNKVLRDLEYEYSSSPYVGMCWIFEEVLGINPKGVKIGGIDLKSNTYETFMYKADGVTKRFWDDHTVATLTVSFTPEQRVAIREWWDFLPPEIKND